MDLIHFHIHIHIHIDIDIHFHNEINIVVFYILHIADDRCVNFSPRFLGSPFKSRITRIKLVIKVFVQFLYRVLNSDT